MKRLVLLGFLSLVGGCAGSVTADPNEETTIAAPPVAAFDPANQVIPFPNNLVLDPKTQKVNIPAQPCESAAAAVVRGQLNQLDGFGTLEPAIFATFTAPVDAASLDGHVFLVRLAGPGLMAPEVVPVDTSVQSTIRFGADCASPMTVADVNVSIAPRSPLIAKSTYGALLVRGIKTQTGAEFQPSATWALVRQTKEPVQLATSGESIVVTFNATPFDPTNQADFATIQGLDLLWKAHNVKPALLPAFDALLPQLTSGAATGRGDMLLAWSFNTQTIADPFLPSVTDSPASALTSDMAPDAPVMPATPLAGPGGIPITSFYLIAFPDTPCAALRCSAVGSVYLGSTAFMAPDPTFVSPSFQSGGFCNSPPTPPGSWSDPLKPATTCYQTIPFLAVIPAAPPGPAGYKTVIFSHGITRRKEDLLAVAGLLASQGFASVAIDAVDHGARAIVTSTDAAQGCAAAGMGNSCAGAIDPTCAPQCYAPILSPDLAATRDSLRQTVLDQMKLERVLKHCATQNACGSLWVDADHIGYVGQSLGSLIGGVTVAVSPDVKAAVLNVGGADWLRILTDTATLGIRCPLVDSLVTAGVLPGGDAAKWNLGANPSALCVGNDWKSNPGFLQFAQSLRWMLDPVDGANYASMYGADRARVLLAEVVNDEVVPNTATEEFGPLLGLTPTPAATSTSTTPAPTPALTMPGSYWVQYANIDAAGAFPGNFFSHGSLLQPAKHDATSTMPDPAGVLGTALMQTDTVTFFATNLAAGL